MPALGATSPLAHELAKDRFAPDRGAHLFMLKDRLRMIRSAQSHCNATAVVAIAAHWQLPILHSEQHRVAGGVITPGAKH
jgi:hypothetical protein